MITSAELLDAFRRDRACGINNDIDLSLRPAYRELLRRLGNPETKLPPVFHVAGTNGKGSTCAFLRAMLEAADYRVHVYTSPHLVNFHERIRLAGDLIGEVELAEILSDCQRLSADHSVTYFEAATAAAFTAFARHRADFTIVEVGLGGRLDATNVIAKPLASIITRLSMDHRDYLGDTITAIASEKAGIMREAVPCFAAVQPDEEARKVLRDAAAKIHAPLFLGNENWHAEKTAAGFSYRDHKHHFALPPPVLPGEHQFDNAGLALAALLNSGVERINERTIIAGLQKVSWPARLQHLETGALVSLLPKDSELWLDGGHNDSAGEALAVQAKIWAAYDRLPLHLICGMLTTKHPVEFLTPLQPYIAGLNAVSIPNEPQSFSVDDLAKCAREAGIENISTGGDVNVALKNLAVSSTPKRILICGSLYLAGCILRANDNKIL